MYVTRSFYINLEILFLVMMEPQSESKTTNFIKLPFAYPQFGKLWSAQLVNNIGNQFTLLALQFLIYHLTDSILAIGILAICESIPMIVVGPYAGVLIDRFDRKKIMYLSNIVQAFWILMVPVSGYFLSGMDRAVFICFLAFFMGITNRFFYPSRSASIPKLVSKKDLLGANSLSAATYQLSALIGPITAGYLVTIFSYDAAFLIDVVGFLLSAFFISRITTSLRANNNEITTEMMDYNLNQFDENNFEVEQKERHRRDSVKKEFSIVKKDMREAFSYLRSYNPLIYIISLFTIMMFTFGSVVVLMIPFLESIPNLGLEPETAFGTISSIAALVGLTLAIIVGRRKKLPRPLTLMTISSFVGSLIVLGIASTTDIFVITSFWALFGAVQVFIMIPFQLIMQETIPDLIRGKIISMFNLIFSTAQIIGMGLGGIFGELFDITSTFIISGVFAMLIIFILAYNLITKNIDAEIDIRIKELEDIDANHLQ